jgi:hypothetical protein
VECIGRAPSTCGKEPPSRVSIGFGTGKAAFDRGTATVPSRVAAQKRRVSMKIAPALTGAEIGVQMTTLSRRGTASRGRRRTRN